MLFTDDIILTDESLDETSSKLEIWKLRIPDLIV